MMLFDSFVVDICPTYTSPFFRKNVVVKVRIPSGSNTTGRGDVAYMFDLAHYKNFLPISWVNMIYVDFDLPDLANPMRIWYQVMGGSKGTDKVPCKQPTFPFPYC